MTRPEKVAKMVHSRNSKTGVRISNSRVKRHAFHVTRKQIFLIIIMLFLFMGSSIGYVWSTFESTQIGYDLSQLQKEEMRLLETNRKLKLELAVLKSPQNLEAIATQKLGLGQPSSKQIIVLQ
ncbi:MAG: cell division protein FtsL [Deltaproteobacteria bacterium]|nr:cell division protein FtsL [Deltaproteobacteria bacterium]MBW2117651.1 cell division protein FtsL [Deltaproteobacteria bacterium]MBW2344344.1 cell division protein FtsL [Deltaproteobacteria bacterium]